MLLHPQTFFLVQRYNPLRRIQWPKVKVTDKGQIVIKMDEKHETTGCYFIHRLLTSILTSIISAFCDTFGRCHLVCIVYCPMTHFSLDGWTNAVRHVKNPRLPPQTSLDLLFSCMYVCMYVCIYIYMGHSQKVILNSSKIQFSTAQLFLDGFWFGFR